MGRITAIKLQKRNPQRVNIYIDGEYRFALYRITAAWLQVGHELSDEKAAQLQAEDGREAAYQQAIRFLGYRPRSENEIVRKLEEKDFPPQVIAGVVERLRQSGLVDDHRFAQGWVENRSEFRPRSRRALARELHQRGLSDEAITEATAGIDDEEQAYRAGLKHSRKLHEADWPGFRQKLSGFLARRGFNYDVIAPVVQRIWQEKLSDENND